MALALHRTRLHPANVATSFLVVRLCPVEYKLHRGRNVSTLFFAVVLVPTTMPGLLQVLKKHMLME